MFSNVLMASRHLLIQRHKGNTFLRIASRFKMEKVINLGIPHVGEQIFESIDTSGLIQCLLVSKTWKVLAENVLMKRWNGKMFEACKSGETKVVQLLLEGCNCACETLGLSSKDGYGLTAFAWACIDGHKNIVQLLLDHSKPKNVCGREKRPAAGAQRAKRAYHRKPRSSCRRQPIVSARDNDGWTAVMWACKKGHKDVVQLLLDHCVDLNARNGDRFTAFMWACKNGHKDVVKLLLDHQDQIIELNTRDNDGCTAFMWACENGHQDVVQLLLNHQDLNIDLKEKDNFGVTGFMKACKSGFKDVVKMLLNHLDHIEQINSGWTIFYTDVGEHYMLSKEIRNLIEMFLSKP